MIYKDNYTDYLLIIYDLDGNLLHAEIIDPNDEQAALTSVSVFDNNIFFAGYNGVIDHYRQQVFKYKIDQKTTTSIPLAATTGLLLYPNPTKETLTAILDGDQKKDGQFLLYNNLGRLLKSQDYQATSSRNTISFDLAGLASGLFWLVFSGNDGTQIGQRLVIQ